MIRVATYDQGIAEEERQREELEAPVRQALSDSLAEEDDAFKMALAGRIEQDWSRNRQDKTKVEHSMLECARERKGEYGPEELRLIEQAGGSDIYLPVATAKIRAGIAHVKAIYLTSGHSSHGIAPTPNPELPTELEEMVASRILENPNMVDSNGQPISPMDQIELLSSMARRELEQMSRNAARRHERVIEDQLIQGGYQRALSQFIEDFCTYPAAFLKGPYFAVKPRLKWQRDAKLGMRPAPSFDLLPSFRTIDPFDAYPAAGSDSVQKGAFIERLRMDRGELYRMREQPGYNEAAVLDALADADSGKLTDWLWTDSSRAAIANHNYWWMDSTTDLDGLHWYSQARGTELLEWGMSPELIADPLEFYEVDAILIGRHVVRASLNPDPLFRRHIHSAAYERIPGAVFGNSISMLMRSSQRMINATARSLQNNVAYASGFQTEVNHERVAPETDLHDMHPYKVWQTDESEKYTTASPAVRFFQPDDRSASLVAIIETWKNYTDTDTGIPEFLSGGQGGGNGADETARGRAMLLDASAKLLRSAIMNIDEDIIVPMIELLYTHNMLHHPDPEIKGDCQVVARGANAILQRESARQEKMAVMELTGNEMDSSILGLPGRAKLLKGVLDTFDDMDGVLPDGEEFDLHVQSLQTQQQQPPPPDAAMMKVEVTREVEMAKLALEDRRLQHDQVSSDPAAAERLKAMELASRERVAQAQLDKQMRDEIIKFRAEQMAERKKAQIDVAVAKMQAEAQIQLKVAEMRANQTNQREQRQFDADMAPVAAEPADDVLSPEDVKAAVESSIMPLLAAMRTETQEDTRRAMDELMVKFQSENAAAVPVEPPVFNIHVDAKSDPVAKDISAKKGADGAFTGAITPRRGR